MQVYTKILIGMAAGAAIGVFLGPKSFLLPADTYAFADAAKADLWTEPGGGGEPVRLAGKIPVQLEILETRAERRVDEVGVEHEVPVWAKVRFQVTQQMVLRADEALSRQLGHVRAGQRAELWLRLAVEPLAGGGFATLPVPQSGVGLTVTAWLRPVGKAFMSLIKMVIVPLVFSSLLVGIAGLGDIRKLGRLGGKTLGLYMVTTGVAVSIGLLVAQVISPGSFVSLADRAALQAQFSGDATQKAASAAAAPSMVDNLLAIIPENPIGSLASGDMLQIIFFAVIFGVALTMLEQKNGTPVVTFFDRVQHAMVMVIHMVMALAPYGVAALVADVVGQSGLSVLQALLAYALAVLLGLALHAVLVYGGLVRFLVRMPLRTFFRGIRPAQLIAFSTSSSSAALPVSMECAEENLGVSNSVASFVLPLGATVNMDGTALYQGVAAVFIAQVFEIDLSLADQAAIVLTATMASIGAAGVPGAGMVTLAMVLTTAGIPAVGVALILGMDRILDMFRTTVNITGDLAVAAAMAVTEGERLSVLSPEQEAADPHHGFENRLHHPSQPVEPD